MIELDDHPKHLLHHYLNHLQMMDISIPKLDDVMVIEKRVLDHVDGLAKAVVIVDGKSCMKYPVLQNPGSREKMVQVHLKQIGEILTDARVEVLPDFQDYKFTDHKDEQCEVCGNYQKRDGYCAKFPRGKLTPRMPL